MPRKHVNSKGARPNGRGLIQDSWLKAEHRIFNSKNYKALTPVQRALFWDLASSYDGKNNGDLVLTPTFAKDRNWVYSTVIDNKDALIKSGLIRLVGIKPISNVRSMNLYALSWLPINEDCNEWIEEDAKKKPVLSIKNLYSV